MSELRLREVPEGRGNNFEACDDTGQIIGRIVLLTALASRHEKPWMWLIDSAFHEGREHTYGFEASREAAMQSFARCWFRDREGAGESDARMKR